MSLTKVRDLMWDYKYLVEDYDFSTFVETVINELKIQQDEYITDTKEEA